MSDYLSVSITDLSALVRELNSLLTALQEAEKAAKKATKTTSWKGPAAERYRSETEKHHAKLKTAVAEVEAGIKGVKSDIELAREVKAAEAKRLAWLAQQAKVQAPPSTNWRSAR
jgi:hypothetical protein